ELLTDLPVRLGGEGALGWHVLADDLVVVLTGPAGSLSVEHVRDVQHELVALGLEGGELALQRLDPLPHLAHVRLHVLARRPAATRFIALGVERLDLAPEVARLPVERQDALEGRHVEAARGEHIAHFLGVLAHALERRHSSACHYPCSPVYDVVLVAFEGPDRYSFVGGLATRMIDLADALVDRGYFVHHVFVGDPKLPAREERAEGRLILERWSQWISAYHPRDVYDGEDGKWRDFSRTVPAHLADVVIASAAEGRKSVLLFEDWQTADAAIATAAILNVRMPGAAAILWNANNTYGFGSADFPLLRLAASMTTVSRFMRAEMSAVGVDAAVLPNAIAERFLKPIPPAPSGPSARCARSRAAFWRIPRRRLSASWVWRSWLRESLPTSGGRARTTRSRSAMPSSCRATIRASCSRRTPRLALGRRS